MTEPKHLLVPLGGGTVGPAPAPGLPSVEVKLAAAAGAALSVVEYTVPAGFSPPPHLHRQTREDVTVYVVSGELHYWFVDGDAIAPAGTLVHLPRGTWSRWSNDSDGPCRMIAMFSPAGFEQYFLDLGAAMTEARGDQSVLRATIERLRDEYGDEPHPNHQPSGVRAGDGP